MPPILSGDKSTVHRLTRSAIQQSIQVVLASNYGPSSCPFNAATRYCQNGLYGYGDSRAYPAGFYEYHNSYNKGSNSTAFVVVSDGLRCQNQ